MWVGLLILPFFSLVLIPNLRRFAYLVTKTISENFGFRCPSLTRALYGCRVNVDPAATVFLDPSAEPQPGQAGKRHRVLTLAALGYEGTTQLETNRHLEMTITERVTLYV